MKRMKYVRFIFPDEKIFVVKQILEELGLKVPDAFEGENQKYFPTYHIVILPEDSEKLKSLLSKLAELCINSRLFMRNEQRYTKKELKDADLLWIHANKQPDDGFNVYGTIFSGDNICHKCGSGLTQQSDLVLKTSAFKKKHFSATFNFEYVVSTELATAIRENFSGFLLKPVIDYRTKIKSEQLLQFVPVETLPKLVAPTVIDKSSKYCQQCNKCGLFLESEMHIKCPPENFSDAYFTREIFGEIRTRGIPGPELVLSKNLVNKIKEFDKRAMQIEPVFLGEKVFKF